MIFRPIAGDNCHLDLGFDIKLVPAVDRNLEIAVKLGEKFKDPFGFLSVR